jgi:hypothetical protein
MKYKLTVIKYEKNDNYEAEMAKWKEQRSSFYGRNEPSFDEPRLETAGRSLEVFLTEEEYNEVKKSVLSIFK